MDRRLILCSSAWQTGFHDLRKDMCQRCGLLKQSKQKEASHMS